MKKVKKTLLSLMLFLLGGIISIRNVYADVIASPIEELIYDLPYYFSILVIIIVVVILSVVILKLLCKNNKDKTENK